MIEYDIATRLLAVSGVTDIVGTGTEARVHIMHLPQRARFPAITIQVISGAPEYDMEGQAGVADVRLQIDCWAHREQPTQDAYDQARTLGEAVRAALTAFKGTAGASTIESCFLLNRRALHDDQAGMYRESQDWGVGYAET